MASWRALSLKRETKYAASLFIKGQFTDSTYTVFLTDLVYLWTEQLDRRAIMRRAMNEDTTIDPTNGPDQLKTLLDHLSGCIEGKSSTSAVLQSTSSQQQLNLTLTSKLPSPLEPLRWPLELKLDAQQKFSAELLQPALNTLAHYRVGMSSLVSLLKEKDNVIQKLQDKIEVSGMDLGAVFPGAGLRKGTSGKKSQRVVPGLAEFDYDSWIASTLNLQADPFVTGGLPSVANLDPRETAPDSVAWWEDLPAGDQKVDISDQPARSRHTFDADSDIRMAETGDVTRQHLPEDPDSHTKTAHSQNQAIPERSKSFRKGSQSSTSSGEDTSQFEQMQPQQARNAMKDEIEDSPPTSSVSKPAEEAHTVQVASSPVPAKRIGKLGGKKQSTPPAPGIEKISETQSKEQAEPTAASPKKTSKLGKIGGAAKAASPQSKDKAPATIDRAPIKREGSTERQGRAETVSATNHDRETSQERADRRRAELKRQLEEKRKLPGAKKKQRKF